VSWLYGRPTAAELVAAVADFLDNDVRSATGPDSRLADAGQVNFHARVAANVLRIVERELTDESATEVTGRLGELGFADEAQLASAIRAGKLDDRGRRAADPARGGPPSAGGRSPGIRRILRQPAADALRIGLTTAAAPAGTRRDRWPKVFRANAPHRSGSPPAPRPSPDGPLW